MRLIAFLPLLALALLVAEEKSPQTPAPRSREAFVAALRAAYDDKTDELGRACKVIEGPRRELWIQRGNTQQRYPSSRLAPGDVAPEPKGKGWLNTSGGAPDTRGKVVWIEFSATWCGPCKQSMPRVQELYAKHRERGLEVVVVTDESAEVFAPYMKANGYTMPAAVGTAREVTEGAFGVRGWPTAFLVGRDGRIAYVGDPRDEQLEQALERLLAAK